MNTNHKNSMSLLKSTQTANEMPAWKAALPAYLKQLPGVTNIAVFDHRGQLMATLHESFSFAFLTVILDAHYCPGVEGQPGHIILEKRGELGFGKQIEELAKLI